MSCSPYLGGHCLMGKLVKLIEAWLTKRTELPVKYLGGKNK